MVRHSVKSGKNEMKAAINFEASSGHAEITEQRSISEDQDIVARTSTIKEMQFESDTVDQDSSKTSISINDDNDSLIDIDQSPIRHVKTNLGSRENTEVSNASMTKMTWKMMNEANSMNQSSEAFHK